MVYSQIEHRNRSFPHVPQTYILAWTTTPWTIPAHMSMALNKNLAYSRVLFEGNYYITATARVETVFKGKEYEIIESFTGEHLIGLKYEAPFSFYQ
jgi:isoleucyl-tRNA synthetase